MTDYFREASVTWGGPGIAFGGHPPELAVDADDSYESAWVTEAPADGTYIQVVLDDYMWVNSLRVVQADVLQYADELELWTSQDGGDPDGYWWLISSFHVHGPGAIVVPVVPFYNGNAFQLRLRHLVGTNNNHWRVNSVEGRPEAVATPGDIFLGKPTAWSGGTGTLLSPPDLAVDGDDSYDDAFIIALPAPHGSGARIYIDAGFTVTLGQLRFVQAEHVQYLDSLFLVGWTSVDGFGASFSTFLDDIRVGEHIIDELAVFATRPARRFSFQINSSGPPSGNNGYWRLNTISAWAMDYTVPVRDSLALARRVKIQVVSNYGDGTTLGPGDSDIVEETGVIRPLTFDYEALEGIPYGDVLRNGGGFENLSDPQDCLIGPDGKQWLPGHFTRNPGTGGRFMAVHYDWPSRHPVGVFYFPGGDRQNLTAITHDLSNASGALVICGPGADIGNNGNVVRWDGSSTEVAYIQDTYFNWFNHDTEVSRDITFHGSTFYGPGYTPNRASCTPGDQTPFYWQWDDPACAAGVYCAQSQWRPQLYDVAAFGGRYIGYLQGAYNSEEIGSSITTWGGLVNFGPAFTSPRDVASGTLFAMFGYLDDHYPTWTYWGVDPAEPEALYNGMSGVGAGHFVQWQGTLLVPSPRSNWAYMDGGERGDGFRFWHLLPEADLHLEWLFSTNGSAVTPLLTVTKSGSETVVFGQQIYVHPETNRLYAFWAAMDGLPVPTYPPCLEFPGGWVPNTNWWIHGCYKTSPGAAWVDLPTLAVNYGYGWGPDTNIDGILFFMRMAIGSSPEDIYIVWTDQPDPAYGVPVIHKFNMGSNTWSRLPASIYGLTGGALRHAFIRKPPGIP